MPLIACERCGSDDIERDPSAARPVLTVRCVACGHAWTRTPSLVCPRCGSSDVETGVVDGWAYDDREEVRANPSGAPWSLVDRNVHQCRKCRNKWQTVEGARPYVPPIRSSSERNTAAPFRRSSNGSSTSGW